MGCLLNGADSRATGNTAKAPWKGAACGRAPALAGGPQPGSAVPIAVADVLLSHRYTKHCHGRHAGAIQGFPRLHAPKALGLSLGGISNHDPAPSTFPEHSRPLHGQECGYDYGSLLLL